MTNASAANASPLRRLAMLPAVNNRILNRDRSSAGYLDFRSIMMKMAKPRTLATTTAWFAKSVRLPSVRPKSNSVIAMENVMAPGVELLSCCRAGNLLQPFPGSVGSKDSYWDVYEKYGTLCEELDKDAAQSVPGYRPSV